MPLAWEPFELAIRAIVGQQVSVRAATTLMGRLVARLGSAVDGGLSVFPAPGAIAEASTGDLGVTAARADALRALARESSAGRLRLTPDVDVAQTVRALVALPGIGDWTTQYIAMRGLGDPDAFPTGDLGLRIAAGGGVKIAARELSARAEHWRPWRAYAAMHLWQSLTDSKP